MSGVRLRTWLDAPVDRTWRALVAPEGLARWRAPWVEVDGDRVVCWWAGELESAYQVIERVEGSVIELHDAARGLFVRLTVAPERDGTLLLVDLGGPGPDALEGLAEGWEAMLVALAHAVEVQEDAPCEWAIAAVPVRGDPDRVWDRAVTALRSVERLETLAEGEALTVRPGGGEAWPGVLVRHAPPRHLAMTLAALDEALLSLQVLPGAAACQVTVEVLLPGASEALVDRVQARVERWLAEVDGTSLRRP